jgi:hypothetical protein
VLCAVSIIPFNKWLFKRLGFHYILTLGFFHYVATYFTCVAMVQSGLVEKKPFNNLRDFLPVTVLNAAALCMLNLSLANNSIAVYQLAKMLTVPGTVLLTYLMYVLSPCGNSCTDPFLGTAKPIRWRSSRRWPS